MATKQSDAGTTEQVDASAEPVNTLGHYLVVRHAFANYRKGDAIRDPAEIAAVKSGENAHFVHKVIG